MNFNMPITTSATRALRQDRRRAIVNLRARRRMKEAIKAMRQKPTEKALKLATSFIDRAAKVNIIHKNKAARLKSQISKLLKLTPKTVSKPVKKSPSKQKTSKKAK